MRQNETVFANFILKFGDLDLIDLLEPVVLRAFTDDALYRTSHGSTFHLLDVRLMEFTAGEGDYALAGRFVRDTVLRRVQVYIPDEGLVHDEQELPSSPSSFFVLFLDNHRMIFRGETPNAPDLSLFKSTLSNFIDRKYDVYIREEHARRNALGGGRVTLKGIREEILPPNLNVIPITNSDSVEDFIGKYETLRRVELIVHKPNPDSDAEDLFEGMNEFRKKLGADEAKLSASEPQGLDPKGAIEALQSAGVTGNQTVRLSGIDADGNKLVGSNEDFSVRADIRIGQVSTRRTARLLKEKMDELVDAGILKVTNGSRTIRRHLRGLLQDLL